MSQFNPNFFAFHYSLNSLSRLIVNIIVASQSLNFLINYLINLVTDLIFEKRIAENNNIIKRFQTITFSFQICISFEYVKIKIHSNNVTSIIDWVNVLPIASQICSDWNWMLYSVVLHMKNISLFVIFSDIKVDIILNFNDRICVRNNSI